MASIARGIEPTWRDRPLGAQFLLPGRPTPTGQLLMTLTGHREGFTFTPAQRTAPGPGRDGAQRTRRGCRDFAALMMEAVRSLRLAARFVSGYLTCRRDQARAREYVGGGSTTRWCQVYLPGAGWVEFDPTNGIIGNRDLIRVAVARDPSQAVPLSGTYAGSPDDELGMKVQVNVEAETQPEDAHAPGR